MDFNFDIFNIFEHDENFREIMKRLLEASITESFNGILITEAGPGYPIVYANAAFSEMTGYAPDEVMGKSPAMLQGPKTDADVISRLGREIEDGKLFHGRAVNYRKDGSEFMMEWKIVPIRNAFNDISHYLAIQKDVTATA
ncbi:MAG: PAS domain-containing protein [Desulfobacterales bacterium]|nr:PAS domain-containing protein [Desulfobacterales bacterium]MDJ0874601.1 PAS domain-containing protein [Desulfobacterales bacterium]